MIFLFISVYRKGGQTVGLTSLYKRRLNKKCCNCIENLSMLSISAKDKNNF